MTKVITPLSAAHKMIAGTLGGELMIGWVECAGRQKMIRLLLTPAFTLGAISVALAQGDPTKGATVFDACRHCHIADTPTNRVGPYLKGVFGRRAAIAEGYHYSPAMKAKGDAGLVWTEENLDAYLAYPQGFIPHNKMLFGGVKDPEDRAKLIAYLKSKM